MNNNYFIDILIFISLLTMRIFSYVYYENPFPTSYLVMCLPSTLTSSSGLSEVFCW